MLRPNLWWWNEWNVRWNRGIFHFESEKSNGFRRHFQSDVWCSACKTEGLSAFERRRIWVGLHWGGRAVRNRDIEVGSCSWISIYHRDFRLLGIKNFVWISALPLSDSVTYNLGRFYSLIEIFNRKLELFRNPNT